MHRKSGLYQTSAAIGLALFAAQSVSAQQSPASGDLPRNYQQFTSHLKAEGYLPTYLDTLRTQFADLDADRDGKISQRDADLHEAIARGRQRSQSAMSMLHYDIDGDGVVTTAEVRVAMAYDQRTSTARANTRGGRVAEEEARQLREQIQRLTDKDADGDGKITFAEAVTVDDETYDDRSSRNSYTTRVKNALTLDGVRNGQLEQTVWLAKGEALFRKIDVDKDGKLGQQELVNFWQNPSVPDAAAQQQAIDNILARSREIEAKPQRVAQPGADAGCAMPAASAQAKVLLLGTYDTPALSSATIGSDEAVVHAGKVVIEPGTQPLYIVLATYAASIWQFSGAVERVERVILGSTQTMANGGDPNGTPLIGATGLPKAKISFLARAGCLPGFHEAPSSASIGIANKLRTQIGREVDGTFGRHGVMRFNLPSGRIEEIKNRNDGKLVIQGAPPGSIKVEGDASNIIFEAGPSSARDSLYRFNPAGVITIDPKTVVASRPVKSYGTLPQEAGLVQLLASGALKQNSSGEYVVQKAMTFPSGLHGAHLVRFVVPKGVPMPKGDPGHSCVVADDGSKPRGAGCQ